MGIFDLLGWLFGATWPVILLVVVGITSVRIIDQKSVGIVTQFGRYQRSLNAGLNFIIPVIQQVVARVDLRVREVAAKIEIKTADDVFVTVPVTIMVKVIERSAADAYYQLAEPVSSVKSWVLASLKASVAAMELKELFKDRARLEKEVKDELQEKMRQYGYEIVSVLLDQPSVTDEMQATFNRVVSSQREKEAATYEAEAKKIKMVGEAQAEAEAQEERAKGLAKARQILVTSLAETVVQAKQSGMDEKDVMHLLLETNRLETIKAASEHGKLILMDARSVPNVNVG